MMYCLYLCNFYWYKICIYLILQHKTGMQLIPKKFFQVSSSLLILFQFFHGYTYYLKGVNKSGYSVRWPLRSKLKVSFKNFNGLLNLFRINFSVWNLSKGILIIHVARQVQRKWIECHEYKIIKPCLWSEF